jgi:hypothetical protein
VAIVKQTWQGYSVCVCVCVCVCVYRYINSDISIITRKEGTKKGRRLNMKKKNSKITLFGLKINKNEHIHNLVHGHFY